MKKMVIVFLFCLQSQIYAVTYFRDGQVHNIDYNVGTVAGYINVENNFWGEPTTINLLAGGYMNGSLQAYDNSIINLSGGDIKWSLSLKDYSIFTFSAGSIGDRVNTERNTNMFMTGGYIAGDIWHHGTLNMSDGQIAYDLLASNFSTTVLSGGVISGSLFVYTEADVTIIGKDFLFDGRSVFDNIANPSSEIVYGQLTGKYPDGSFIDISLNMHPEAFITLMPDSSPIADASGPYVIYVGDTLTLDANGSTDPDNDIVSYLWDMDYDDIFETDTGDQPVFDVSYSYLQSLGLLINYEYGIRLKVTDSEGQSDIVEATFIILPKPAVNVTIDIKPGSCPNPVNTKSSGILPVAVLGSNDYDITTIDPASIRLAGIEPLRSSYEDVAAPVLDSNDCNCTEAGPDGLLDLTLKFETQRIVEAMGDVNDGDILTLELTGVLYDPTPFETPIAGTDCILIKGKHKACNKADLNGDGIVNSSDFAIIAENWLESQ